MNWGFVMQCVGVALGLFGAYCVARFVLGKGPILRLETREKIGMYIAAGTGISLIYAHNGQAMLGLLFAVIIVACGIADARSTSKTT